jgi:hypothetical protein
MVENIYTAVQTIASKLYKKHRDGLKYEQMIIGMMTELGEFGYRSLTEPHVVQGESWSPDFAHGGSMYMCFTSKILPLPESIVNGFGHQQRIDKNHFMMQVFRIPLREECNLGNLLRIACYTGILLSCMKADDFPEGVVRTFKALNMHSLDCYIDIERFTEATKDITKEDISRITQAMITGNMGV